jgi:hypothetical protein
MDRSFEKQIVSRVEPLEELAKGPKQLVYLHPRSVQVDPSGQSEELPPLYKTRGLKYVDSLRKELFCLKSPLLYQLSYELHAILSADTTVRTNSAT